MVPNEEQGRNRASKKIRSSPPFVRENTNELDGARSGWWWFLVPEVKYTITRAKCRDDDLCSVEVQLSCSGNGGIQDTYWDFGVGFKN